MKNCRVCNNKLSSALYTAKKPSITSVRKYMDTPLEFFLCNNCGLGQKPVFFDIDEYYDKDYRISMQSQDFDQLYDVEDGNKIFRSDHQADVIINATSIQTGIRVLDYGAGKATTLRKIFASRPDIQPYVFDTGHEYQKVWADFIPIENQAICKYPQNWKGHFGLILLNFVLEHVAEPRDEIVKIAELLHPDGTVVFMVPDCIANPGDLLAVDHINHFSSQAILRLFSGAGLSVKKMDWNVFRGAVVGVACHPSEKIEIDETSERDFVEKIKNIAAFWASFDNRLELALKKYRDCPAAIYGAGVYGSYIAAKIIGRSACKCFIDRNPYLVNTTHMGLPVLSPGELPREIEVIYAGLNPKIAHDVLDSMKTHPIKDIVFFDYPLNE